METETNPLVELDRLRRRHPLAFYWHGQPGLGGMSPPQRRFHEDRSQSRFALWANKLGKTYGPISAELWGDLTDSNPYQDPLPRPCRIGYAVPDLNSSYADDVCTVLRQLEPPGVLHEACRYDRARGYLLPGGRRGILTAAGDTVVFRSSHQELTSSAGFAVHKLYLNEPPKQAHWGELLRAVSETNGRVVAAMTLVNKLGTVQSYEWLHEIVTGDGSDWSFHHAELTHENAPHRTPEDIERQIRMCPWWEYDQRILARWDAPNVERLYQGFERDRNIQPDDIVPADSWLSLSFDHGERPGAEAVHLVAHWTDSTGGKRAHIIARYQSAGRTTVAQDALAVKTMLEGLGFTLDHVKRGRGDTNSAGKDSEIRTVNKAFEQAFASLCGRKWSRPPFRIEAPDKRPGSREYGHGIVNLALLEGTLTMSPQVKETIREFEVYRGGKTGADGELSHGMDSVRYDVYDDLDTTERGYDRDAWNKYVDSLQVHRGPVDTSNPRIRAEYGPGNVGGYAVRRGGAG